MKKYLWSLCRLTGILLLLTQGKMLSANPQELEEFRQYETIEFIEAELEFHLEMELIYKTHKPIDDFQLLILEPEKKKDEKSYYTFKLPVISFLNKFGFSFNKNSSSLIHTKHKKYTAFMLEKNKISKSERKLNRYRALLTHSPPPVSKWIGGGLC